MSNKQNNNNCISFLQSINKKIAKIDQQVSYIAYVYSIASNIFLVLLQINFKIVSTYINPFHALALRGFFLLFFNSFLINFNKLSLDIRSPTNFTILMKRIIISSVSVSFMFAPLKYLPAGNVNALINTSPIIIFFIEAVKYKKVVNKNQLLLTVLSFIGILLVIQPQFLFGQSIVAEFQSQKYLLLLTLFAAVTNSVSMLYLHELKGRVQGIICLHYFYIGQCFFNNLAMITQQIDYSQTNLDWLFYICLVFLVLFSYLYQYFNTKAMMIKQPSKIMPLGYITIILSSIVDFFYFGYNFTVLGIVGMVLTGSGLLIKLIIPQDKIQNSLNTKKIKTQENNVQEAFIRTDK